MRATLYTDGGARGNPGPAASAFVLEAEDGTVLDARGDTIGVATNNVAEYRALVAGLERAVEAGVDELEVVSDSELLVKQMRGEYRVKNAALRELSLEAARLAREIGKVTLPRGSAGAQRARRPARERGARPRRVLSGLSSPPALRVSPSGPPRRAALLHGRASGSPAARDVRAAPDPLMGRPSRHTPGHPRCVVNPIPMGSLSCVCRVGTDRAAVRAGPRSSPCRRKGGSGSSGRLTRERLGATRLYLPPSRM